MRSISLGNLKCWIFNLFQICGRFVSKKKTYSFQYISSIFPSKLSSKLSPNSSLNSSSSNSSSNSSNGESSSKSLCSQSKSRSRRSSSKASSSSCPLMKVLISSSLILSKLTSSKGVVDGTVHRLQFTHHGRGDVELIDVLFAVFQIFGVFLIHLGDGHALVFAEGEN